MLRKLMACWFALGALSALAQTPQTGPPRPRVIVVSVNGGEWDIIRPLLERHEMPNLAWVMERGVSGKLRTVSAPTCPKTYSVLQTSTPTEENGISAFQIKGVTASTSMLKTEPLWSILSKHGVRVGMANVPATFPALPVNGYTISGMLTRGKGCENGVLCAPKLSEVIGGDAVYPRSLAVELLEKVGDFRVDCLRMPARGQLRGNEKQVVEQWLAQVSSIRAQQAKLFDYLLTHHPTDFTFLVQSCEDRVGHWLYPIQPQHTGYNPRLHNLAADAFPNQYREFDRVLGTILGHVDENTTVLVVSDHGIKPGQAPEKPATHSDPEASTLIVAKHDSADGDEVPGMLIAMGPGIRRGVRIEGLTMSLFDLAPTLLHLYGIEPPARMKGRVLTEIFEPNRERKGSAGSTTQPPHGPAGGDRGSNR